MPPIDVEVNCCVNHSGHAEAIQTLKESDRDQWQAIKALQNRLPLWATLTISGLASVASFVAALHFA